MKQKGKRMLALLLVLAMTMTPVTYLHAEEVEQPETAVPAVLSEMEKQTVTTEAAEPQDETEAQPEEKTEVQPEGETEETAAALEEGSPAQDTAVLAESAAEEKVEAAVQGDAGVKVEKLDGTEFAMFIVTGSAAAESGDRIAVSMSTAKASYSKLYLGSREDSTKEPVIEGVKNDIGGYNFHFTVPASQKGQKVPVVLFGVKSNDWYTKQDLVLTIPGTSESEPAPDPEPAPEPIPEMPGSGQYRVPTVESSASMFRVVDCVLVSKGSQLQAVITLSGTGYDYLYMGTAEAAEKAEKASWIPYVKDPNGKYTYTIPVSALDTEIAVAAHSQKKDQWYDRTLIFRSEGMEKIEAALTDGEYNVPTVESSASMFRVVGCTLTVKGDQMSAVITLSGTGYDYLYMGMAEAAEKAEKASWIPYVEDPNGKYTYTIPVSALDTEIAVAAHSKSKNVWYDRTLLFHSSGIEKLNHSTEPEQPGDGTTGKPDDTTTEPNVPEVKPGTDTRPDTESRYESDLEGSTRRVNNTTKLADGVYTPDKFSWSGGTGRVTISCNKVTVTNGQAYATIVFSSGSYSYVKASGNIYYASHSGDTSSFVIPVELNKNNRVIGMTTKMSASHEVAYNIFIYLAADGAEDNTDSSLNLKLDEKAPTIPGLEYKEAEELAHAEYFRIYHYEQSITLLEIDMTTDTARTAETEASAKKEKPADEEEETAALYGKNVVKYLIVPEDVEIPAGLEKEMIVVQKPADKAYIASDAVLEILDELHMTEVAAAVGCEAEDCQIESISKALEEEKVSFAGTYMEPDYKELLSKECNLAVMPSEILPQEEKEDTEAEEEQLERLLDTAEHLSLLKIPMLVDRSADEKTELAQYEWIKVYGVLFGCEEQAEKLLDAAFQAAEK